MHADANVDVRRCLVGSTVGGGVERVGGRRKSSRATL